MADEAGSVVVKKGCQETQVPTSMLGGYLHIFLNLQVWPISPNVTHFFNGDTF